MQIGYGKDLSYESYLHLGYYSDVTLEIPKLPRQFRKYCRGSVEISSIKILKIYN